MIRSVLVIVVTLAVSAVTASAQARIEQAPMKQIPPYDGKTMFANYCAPCHGKEGKGNGPAAPALNKAPADLTKISARNNGTFPVTRVRRYIEGLDEVQAHGTREMPMWGGLFNALSRDTAQLRVAALSDYLKTLQQ